MLEVNLFYIVLGLLLGLAIGSFLNVVIYRLPIILEAHWQQQALSILGQTSNTAQNIAKDTPNPAKHSISLAFPNSFCPNCRHRLALKDNIPLMSFLLQKGKCRYCHQAISKHYPSVELFCALLTSYSIFHFGISYIALFACLFIYASICLFVIDLHKKILPDAITLPLLWLGLIANLGAQFATLTDAVIGAIIGYLSLWLLFWLFKLLTGKQGMGYGDFKLFAAIGAWFGWQSLIFVILCASILGTVFGLYLILTGKQQRQQPLSFGPFLVVSAIIALFWRTEIYQTYLNFLIY